VGDTLTVTVTVISKHPENHSIELDCQVVNQKGICVLSGTARVLAPTVKVRCLAWLRRKSSCMTPDTLQTTACHG